MSPLRALLNSFRPIPGSLTEPTPRSCSRRHHSHRGYHPEHRQRPQNPPAVVQETSPVAPEGARGVFAARTRYVLLCCLHALYNSCGVLVFATLRPSFHSCSLQILSEPTARRCDAPPRRCSEPLQVHRLPHRHGASPRSRSPGACVRFLFLAVWPGRASQQKRLPCSHFLTLSSAQRTFPAESRSLVARAGRRPARGRFVLSLFSQFTEKTALHPPSRPPALYPSSRDTAYAHRQPRSARAPASYRGIQAVF